MTRVLGWVLVLVAALAAIYAVVSWARGPSPTGPNGVDSALSNIPSHTATADTALARADSALKESARKDSIIDVNNRVVDSLEEVIAKRARERATRYPPPPGPGPAPVSIGPVTLEECLEDLSDREQQVRVLRDSNMSLCRKQSLENGATIKNLQSLIALQKFYIRDTVPRLIKMARTEPRECRRNWLVVHPKCTTADIVTFTAGVLTGAAITR